MKVELNPLLDRIQGKFANLCGKRAYGRNCLTRLSIPYAVSKGSISGDQWFSQRQYALAADTWLSATDAQRAAWTEIGARSDLSGMDVVCRLQCTLSPTSGEVWTLAQRLETETRVYSLAYLGGGRCIAGTVGKGNVYLSTDYGASWTLAQRLGTETYVYSLAYLGGGRCIAGTYPTGQVYRAEW